MPGTTSGSAEKNLAAVKETRRVAAALLLIFNCLLARLTATRRKANKPELMVFFSLVAVSIIPIDAIDKHAPLMMVKDVRLSSD